MNEDQKKAQDQLLFREEAEGEGESMSEMVFTASEYNMRLYCYLLFHKFDIYLFGSESYIIGVGADDSFGQPAVDYTMANQFVRNITTCQELWDEDQTIVIHMNSPGGCWTQGMVIRNAIYYCPMSVVILNYAEARSMSSIIGLAADRLVMMPHDSRFMFHQGTFSFEGTGTQLETEYLQWQKTKTRMEDIYIDAMKRNHGSRRGESRKDLRAWIRAQMKQHEEVYLDPEEAVDLGFAHEVFDGDWDRLREEFED